MATLYVAEFSDTAHLRNSVPIAMAPPLAEQTVAIGGSSTPSTNAFGNATRFVRVHVDAICSIAFGTSPAATTANMRMIAGQTEYFAVNPGGGHKIAVITNS